MTKFQLWWIEEFNRRRRNNEPMIERYDALIGWDAAMRTVRQEAAIRAGSQGAPDTLANALWLSDIDSICTEE